ncbi:hypothetical protein PISMIDRAFT_682790, partial [Pisolithus microcarpus 441]
MDNTLPAHINSTSRLPSPSFSPSQRPRSHCQLSRLGHQNIGLWNPWTGLTGWQLTMWASHIGPTTCDHLRVRSLYPYETQRAEDLNFGDNVVIEVHPSKFGGDWWYETTVNDGRSDFSRRPLYKQSTQVFKATALLSCEGSSPEELSFTERNVLTMVDHLEPDWGRAERDGVVYAMPAA